MIKEEAVSKAIYGNVLQMHSWSKENEGLFSGTSQSAPLFPSKNPLYIFRHRGGRNAQQSDDDFCSCNKSVQVNFGFRVSFLPFIQLGVYMS